MLLRKVNFNHLYSISFTSHHRLLESSIFIFLSREPKLFWGCHWVFPGQCEMGTLAIPAHWRRTLEEFCNRGRFVQVTMQVHQECHQHAPRKIFPGYFPPGRSSGWGQGCSSSRSYVQCFLCVICWHWWRWVEKRQNLQGRAGYMTLDKLLNYSLLHPLFSFIVRTLRSCIQVLFMIADTE